jgi:hypothetical protein
VPSCRNHCHLHNGNVLVSATQTLDRPLGKASLSSNGRDRDSDRSGPTRIKGSIPRQKWMRSGPTRINGDVNLSIPQQKMDDFLTLSTYCTYFSVLSCAISLSD